MLEISHIVPKTTPYRGITIYENKDWAIQAIAAERRAIRPNLEYKDLGVNDNTIYFLVGEDNNYNLAVYVGRALERNIGKSVMSRTSEHEKSKTEQYRDMWDTLITFKFDNITADEVRYLENYFYSHVNKDILQNIHKPDCGVYTVKDIKDKVVYIEEYIKEIIKQNIFIDDPELYTKVLVEKDVQINYSDTEKRSEGKRLVSKDKELVTEVHTLSPVVDQILDSLPKDIWNPHTKFLDPACKNGEFLKVVLNRLLNSPLYNGTEYENPVRKINHIMGEQLYGIALTDVSFNNTIDNLAVSEKTCNIIRINNYIQRLNKDRDGVIKEIIERFRLGENMKFNVIIGNPPYQESTKTIYTDFINTAIEMDADYISMVVKNNWLNSETLKSTRDNMITTGLKEIKNYPVIGDIFSKDEVTVAVSIFTIEQGYKGNTTFREFKSGKLVNEYTADLTGVPVILCNKHENSILNKIKLYATAKNNFGLHTYPSECFRITTNGKVGRGENAYILPTTKVKDDDHNIQVIFMDSSTRPYIEYIKFSDIPNRQDIAGKHKVVCGRILSKNDVVLNNINVTLKNTVCSSSWGVLYATDSIDEAHNVVKYMKTRFVRFLIRLLCEDGVIGVSKYRFSAVPDQNFTSTSDIDWSQSISNIAEQLYKKYNISPEEKAYIEYTIKPMDNAPDIQSVALQTPPSQHQTYTAENICANYIYNQLEN